MKRVLILLALSGFVMACGDDDGDDKDTPDSGTKPDGSVVDGGLDGGAVAAKVTNVGTECGTDNSKCMGPSAVCASKTPTNDTLTGGYCSATCSKAAECGTNGDCPLGEIIAQLGAGNPLLMGLSEGQCWTKCTMADLGKQGTCRTGYACSNISMATGMAPLLPQLSRPVCLPIPTSRGDGGVSDASVVDAAGIDASR